MKSIFRAHLLFVVLLVCLMLPALSLQAIRTSWPDVKPQRMSPAIKNMAPVTSRLIIVLIDALRAKQAFDPALMPSLNRIKTAGCYGIAAAVFPTMSPTGYRAIFSGRLSRAAPQLPGGYFLAKEYDSFFRKATLVGLHSYVTGAEDWKILFGGDYTDGKIITFRGITDMSSDSAFLEYARAKMRDDKKWAVVAIDFYLLDSLGHLGGTSTALYREKLRWLDEQIRVLYEDNKATATILIASQHGSNARGGHWGTEPDMINTPYLFLGKGIRRNIRLDIRQIDLAPTISALLGLNPPDMSEGTALTSILDISPEQEAAIKAANLEQRKMLLTALEEKTHKPSSADQYPPVDSRSDVRHRISRMDEELGKMSQAFLDMEKSKSITFISFAAGMLVLYLLLVIFKWPADGRISLLEPVFALIFCACLLLALSTDFSWNFLGKACFAASFAMVAARVLSRPPPGAGKLSPAALFWLVFNLSLYPLLFECRAAVSMILGACACAAFFAASRGEKHLKISGVFGLAALPVIMVMNFSNAGIFLHKLHTIEADSYAVQGIIFLGYIGLLLWQNRESADSSSITKHGIVSAVIYGIAAFAFRQKSDLIAKVVVASVAALSCYILFCRLGRLGKVVILSMQAIVFARCFSTNHEINALLLCAGVLNTMFLLRSRIKQALAKDVYAGTLLSFFVIFYFATIGNNLTFGAINISSGFLGVNLKYNLWWVASIIGLKTAIPVILFLLLTDAVDMLNERSLLACVAGILAVLFVRFSMLQYYAGANPQFAWEGMDAAGLSDQTIYMGFFAMVSLAVYAVLKCPLFARE